MISVDDIVVMAIEDLFPDQTIPDEDNHLPGGQQHKAPDHAILGGRVLIERKSRNGSGNVKIKEWFDKESTKQNRKIHAYGMQNLSNLIAKLPDSRQANLAMIEFVLRQSLRSVKEARKKFEDHALYIDNSPRLRITILSDNTDTQSSNDFEERYFGGRMGGYSPDHDVTGIIDALILVRHPKFTIDGINSYWFKCLIKKRIVGADYEMIRKVADALYYRLASYAEYLPHLSSFQLGSYAPMIV